VKSAEEQHNQVRANLVNALEDPLLPLAWLGPFWQCYAKQWQQDRQAHHATLLIDEFAKRDQRILQTLTNASPETCQNVAELLQQDLAQFSANNRHTPILQPGADPTEIEPRLTQARDQLKKSLASVEKTAHALEKAQQSIGQIPAEEPIGNFRRIANPH